MRIGKISENTLKRSVLKNTYTTGNRLVHGASPRDNCAVFSYGEEFALASTHQVLLTGAEDSLKFSMLRGVNNIYAQGGKPEAAQLALLLPENLEEPELANLMKAAAKTAKELDISVSGGSTKTDKRIKEPVISVTIIGSRKEKDLPEVEAGWDILLTRPIALSGTAILAKEKEEELKKRYPSRYIEEAKVFDRDLILLPEAATAMKSFPCRMFSVTEGGIFGCLWEAARIAGVGLEIELKKIPIRQESVEICDFLGINPYELMSDGTMLVMTPDGEGYKDALSEEGVEAVLIGTTKANNDKIILNDDEVRYVDKPAADSIYILFE
ncbi:MAG: hydrogenase maturation factor [Lachnospiraceae bacterium]|nr:hydrogenase maturation factor [Lachnospiraceae bacterium]